MNFWGNFWPQITFLKVAPQWQFFFYFFASSWTTFWVAVVWSLIISRILNMIMIVIYGGVKKWRRVFN